MRAVVSCLLASIAVAGCAGPASPPTAERAPAPAVPASGYFDNTGRTDVLAGGVRMIPIKTPKGEFHVWTKRVGNNPSVRVLLLHGGPAATHEYFEAFDSFFPAAGVEYYFYDQLGSFYSDQPTDDSLWTIPRFVDEVEQCGPRSASTKTTSTFSDSRGAASSRSSTRSRTRTISRG